MIPCALSLFLSFLVSLCSTKNFCSFHWIGWHFLLYFNIFKLILWLIKFYQFCMSNFSIAFVFPTARDCNFFPIPESRFCSLSLSEFAWNTLFTIELGFDEKRHTQVCAALELFHFTFAQSNFSNFPNFEQKIDRPANLVQLEKERMRERRNAIRTVGCCYFGKLLSGCRLLMGSIGRQGKRRRRYTRTGATYRAKVRLNTRHDNRFKKVES